ncbi:MAG: hypothetical protein ACJ74H_20245 [Thermoanaerobaculia bacterium]
MTAWLPLIMSLAFPAFGSSVAFHYGPALTRPQLDWFARFEVLVTHDPLPREQVAELHRRGTKLALYEWSVAHYAPAPRLPLLNDKPLRGHAGAEDLDAWYYDPAAPSFAASRTRLLVSRLREVGYDGVFFDTTTEQSVHPAALAEYRRRHPTVPYDQAFAKFLRVLREELKVIITNQGYRAAEHYLPYVDFDVTESLIVLNGRMRPWAEIDAQMQQWILPAARRYPHVRFVHLNYVEVADDASIVPVIAIARMYGHDAFVALPDVTKTAMHEVYFVERRRPAPADAGSVPRCRPVREVRGGGTPALRGSHALP